MAESSTTTNGGMGLTGWLTILFIFLKLNPGGNFDTPIENWSWWWVLSPLWIALALALLFFTVFGIVWVLVERADKRAAKKRREEHLARLRRL